MFESHVTVTGIKAPEFVRTCKELQVKPVLIEMDTGSGISQMMTARFHKGNFEQTKAEVDAIAARFKTVRRKIEVILGPKQPFPKHLYLEFHSKYLVPRAQLDKFISLVEDNEGHTSRNSFKMEPSLGNFYHFVTTRDEAKMRHLHTILRDFRLINTIRECVVFDDNPSVDKHWNECGDCGIKQVTL